MSKIACAAFALLALGAWGPEQAPNNPLDPGGNSSPPGPGCQVGTSGCFPSAPPGPVTPAADPGGSTENPPPVTQTANVPFYGEMPGASSTGNQTLLSPTMQQQAVAEARNQQQQADQARDEQRQKIIDQQQEVIDQQREMMHQQVVPEAQESEQQQQGTRLPHSDEQAADGQGLPAPNP